MLRAKLTQPHFWVGFTLIFKYKYLIQIFFIGIIDRRVMFTPLEELAEQTDFDHRLPRTQWWLKIRPLLRLLAKHQASYVPSSEASGLHEESSSSTL